MRGYLAEEAALRGAAVFPLNNWHPPAAPLSYTSEPIFQVKKLKAGVV